MFKQILAIARKDLRVFFADRRAMMISFLVPIGIASFFSMIFAGNPDSKPTKIKVAVVDLDQSKLTQSILEKLRKSDSVDPVELPDADAHAKVQKGDYSVGFLFPKGFGDAATRSAFYGEKPKLELFFDPSKQMDRQIVNGALMQYAISEIMKSSFDADQSQKMFDDAIATETDPLRKNAMAGMRDSLKQFQGAGMLNSSKNGEAAGFRQPYEVVEKAMTGSSDPQAERTSNVDHIFAGMAMQGVLFFGIEAAMSLLRERKTGIWGRLRAAPVSVGTLVMGRGLGSWIIACLIMIGVFAFGMAVIGVRQQGSFLAFGGVLAAAALMTSGFGLFVASLGKTEAQSRGFAVLAVLLMSMLGGAWFPTSMMPPWVQSVSYAVPVRWAVDGFDNVAWRQQSALVPILGLLGFAIVFSSIASIRMKRL